MHIIGWQQVFIKYWIMNQNYKKSKVRLFHVFRRLHGFSFLKKMCMLIIYIFNQV